MIIGITGNSGSGKSTICAELLKKLDDSILIDADSTVKNMQKEGNSYYIEIVKTFGLTILNEDKTINRKKLGQIVFSNPEKKEKLDNLTRMYVVLEMNKKIEENENKKYVLVDAPLLLEFNIDALCDITIFIDIDEEKKIERICKRDGISKDEAKARISSQNGAEVFTNRIDYVVTNENVDETVSNILEIISKRV